MTPGSRCDVLIVGGGPVGLTLAALLGAAGVSTTLVEAATAPTRLPRAIALHGDALRVLTGLPGLADWAGRLDPVSRVRFLDPGRREIIAVDLGRTPADLPELTLFHQPELETALWGALAALSSVRVIRGSAAVGLDLGERGGRLRLADGRVHGASWVVGCDGAASLTRRSAGIAFAGRSAPGARWLVVDVNTAAPLPGLAALHYLCDPRRPAVSMPRPGGHRWEWRLRAGEDPAELAAPASLHRLLAPWLPAGFDPAGLQVARAAGYTYHARLAERWRHGRLLLAGDAAHCLPPFAGQGLTSGIRDAAALAWRLAAVTGGADPELLAGYERERRPHVRAALRTSSFVGAIVSSTRPAVSGAVVGALRVAGHTPALGPWLRSGGPRPPDRLAAPPRRRRRGGGRLVPHALLAVPGGGPAPLDQLLPARWLVLCLPGAQSVPAGAWRLAPAGTASGPAGRLLHDLDGSLTRLLCHYGGPTACAVLRPDRYLFGIWPAARLPPLAGADRRAGQVAG